MNDKFHQLFGTNKPVIGMLHLKSDDKKSALDRAEDEVYGYLSQGVDALLAENYFGSEKDCEDVLAYLQKCHPDAIYGVNILGDHRKAFELCKTYGAKFIQIDSVCGHLRPSMDLKFAQELDVLRRTCDAVVLGGVRFKYQPIRSMRSLQTDLHLGMERCDAIVVTGEGTGKATPVEKLRQFRDIIGDFPLVTGAGVTLDTVRDTFSESDGAIVGSYFKEGHRDHGDVCREYVGAFMQKKHLCDVMARRLPADELERLYTAFQCGNGQEWADYLRHYASCDEELQGVIGYAFSWLLASEDGYCCANHPLGHFNNRAGVQLPFSFKGWVEEMLFREVWNNYLPGFVYQVEPRCFASESPLLFYADDYMRGKDITGYSQSPLLRLAEPSSGFADVRMMTLPARKNFGRFEADCVLVFRLKAEALRDELVFTGKSRPLEKNERYQLCIPRSGEFDCALGEVAEADLHRLNVLAVDSFCYK